MALALTQPLTEMTARNLVGKARPPRKADNLTAISEPIIWKMWDPWHPIGLHGLLQGQLSLSLSTFVVMCSTQYEQYCSQKISVGVEWHFSFSRDSFHKRGLNCANCSHPSNFQDTSPVLSVEYRLDCHSWDTWIWRHCGWTAMRKSLHLLSEMGPVYDTGLTPGQTGRLTVGRKITLTLTQSLIKAVSL
jgi:hypothetical protein